MAMPRKENGMKLIITKKKLVRKLAEELAYLQIRADWWYYVSNYEDKLNMSSMMFEAVTELRCICKELGLLKEVYEEAYEIYDFRNSGKKDFTPNIELIIQLNKEFCEPRKKQRPVM